MAIGAASVASQRGGTEAAVIQLPPAQHQAKMGFELFGEDKEGDKEFNPGLSLLICGALSLGATLSLFISNFKVNNRSADLLKLSSTIHNCSSVSTSFMFILSL